MTTTTPHQQLRSYLEEHCPTCVHEWHPVEDPADHRCELALKLNAEYAVRHQICRYEPKKQGGEGL